MPSNLNEVACLVNDPVCRLVMEKDGVRPNDVFNMMRSVHPQVGGNQNFDTPPSRPETWMGSPERRRASR